MKKRLIKTKSVTVAVTVERYIAVCKPHQYRAITTVRRRMFMMTMMTMCKPHQNRAITTVRRFMEVEVPDLVFFCFPLSLIKLKQQNQASGIPIAIF